MGPAVPTGLSCPVAWGMLVPRPEIEPVSPAWNRGTLNHLDHQGSPCTHLSWQKPLGRADIKIWDLTAQLDNWNVFWPYGCSLVLKYILAQLWDIDAQRDLTWPCPTSLPQANKKRQLFTGNHLPVSYHGSFLLVLLYFIAVLLLKCVSCSVVSDSLQPHVSKPLKKS